MIIIIEPEQNVRFCFITAYTVEEICIGKTILLHADWQKSLHLANTGKCKYQSWYKQNVMDVPQKASDNAGG